MFSALGMNSSSREGADLAFLDALLQLEREGLEGPVFREVGAGDARLESLFLAGVPLGAQQLGEQRRDRGAVLFGGGEHLIEARGDGLELEVLQQLLEILIHRLGFQIEREVIVGDPAQHHLLEPVQIEEPIAFGIGEGGEEGIARIVAQHRQQPAQRRAPITDVLLEGL